MIFRQQLPGYSPVSLRTLWSGGAGREVERQLSDELSADAVWLTDSGTSALALAILASTPAGQGTVALPAYGCYDLATAAEASGAEVVLYDLDPGTLGPDESSLRGVLDRGVTRLVVVHLFGLPVDLDAVTAIAAEAGVQLIEDAAQGAGSTWAGRPLGSFGQWSVLSFGRGKGRSAGGGGALLGRGEGARSAEAMIDDALDDGEVGVRNFVGWLAQWGLGRPALYGIPASIPALRLGETVYHDPRPPRWISDWCRHAVPSALEASNAETARRREHAARLLAAVRAAPGLAEVAVGQRAQPGYLRLPVRARSTEAARRLQRLRPLGVMPAYPRPLVDLERFASRVRNRDQGFPGAVELADRLHTLPTHSRVTARDLRELTAAIEGIDR